MAHVLATINLKGGVGKTTLTVALAETFASEMGKRVLVIDLDPQTNATVMLIGEARWQTLNARGHTLARLFELALEGSARRFDIAATLQKGVSNVITARTVDLLPSSLDLIDVQDRLWTIPGPPFSSTGPVDQLRRAVQPLLDDYDVVLIDCPPNLGAITRNGLRIARRFIIPTIPDILSTYGIHQIISRVGRFSHEIGAAIAPLGVVINKFQAGSTVHQSILGQLRDDPRLPPIFETFLPQANQTAAAAEFGPMMSYRAKWGYGLFADNVFRLASEILDRLEATP